VVIIIFSGFSLICILVLNAVASSQSFLCVHVCGAYLETKFVFAVSVVAIFSLQFVITWFYSILFLVDLSL